MSAVTHLPINPVQRADLIAVLSLTPNDRRLKVAAAFLGYDLKTMLARMGMAVGTHARFTSTRAYRMRVAASLNVPYSAIWED